MTNDRVNSPFTHTEESHRIFEAIFSVPCPTSLPERFNEASKLIFRNESPSSLSSYSILIRQVKDLEAIELASRLWKKNSLLVSKFRLMVYLAECYPDVKKTLVNSSHAPGIAFFSICNGILRTIYLFIKGSILIALFQPRIKVHD